MRSPISRLAYLLLCAAIVVLPLALLLTPGNVFYIDWLNHVWIVSYYSHFFRSHGLLPDVVNTVQGIGLSQTMFYAHPFYAIAGIMGAYVGPDIGTRIVLFAAVAGQFVLVLRLFLAYSGSRAFATIMATIVSWGIYPLTNLYNRGDITEFVAVCLFNMAVAALLIAAARREGFARARTILAAAFFFTLAAFMHPITGVLGGLILCVLFVVLLVEPQGRGSLVWSGLAGAGLAVIAIAPWLYVIALFMNDLRVGLRSALVTLSFDTLLSRVSPFPIDVRSLDSGVNVSTPYLDAQVNVAIIVLLAGIWVAALSARSSRAESRAEETQAFTAAIMTPTVVRIFGGVAAAGVVYAMVQSLGWLPVLGLSVIEHAQFGYRLVTYVNISLLCLALAATQRYAATPLNRRIVLIGMAAAVTCAFAGVIGKLPHGTAVRKPNGPWQTLEERVNLPETFYSIGDYNVSSQDEGPTHLAALSTTFTPRADHTDFGAVGPAKIVVPSDTLVRSNIYAFPWNHVFIDGVDAPRYSYLDRTARFTSVVLPAGEHTVEYRFIPDPAWTLLRRVSIVVLPLWALGLAIISSASGAAPRRSRGHRQPLARL